MFKRMTQVFFSAATLKIHRDIISLSTRRNKALSVFRKTAEKLGNINEELNVRVSQMDSLTALIAEEKNSAAQMIHDNEAVRSRMLDIIGVTE